MRIQHKWLPLFACGLTLLCLAEARRVRVRPVHQEDEQETIQYYSAQQQDDADQAVVYVSTDDQYNGLYGQPSASPRTSHDHYVQPSRGSASAAKSSRAKEASRPPPVQTIRNYNKVNDDGSFTFGYEAADGSFKEENRGTDCVVRGKYGYIDPDGNKREFTYVSGNPCDPNAPKEEEPERPEDTNEPENVPANYPTRPIRPINRPAKPVTLFQNTYEREEEVQPEPEQVLRQQPIQNYPARPTYIPRTQYLEADIEPQLLQGHTTTPSSLIYKHSNIHLTPRPVTASTARVELPATTYRPQLHVAVTPRPSVSFTKQVSVTPRPSILSPTVPSTLAVTRGNTDFLAEFQRFHESNAISASPSPTAKAEQKIVRPTPSATPLSSAQVYSSELIYDPSTGQYTNQLYQALPQSEGEFTLNQRIQPYVHQPHAQYLNLQQLQQQSPLYRVYRPSPTQALYQQQQAELQFQNSAQLYAQQQQKLKTQPIPTQQPTAAAPSFYYYQPSVQHPQSAVGGQIDSFLRGHNIQF